MVWLQNSTRATSGKASTDNRLLQETTSSETMFLGLRLLDGLHLSEASARAGVDLAEKFQMAIAECIQLGLLEQDGDCLKLTGRSYLVANQAFTRFLE